jgi:chaperonin GroES
MTVQPMSDYVMIRRQRDTQIGHILVPDVVDTKPRIGIVEAVGPGRRLKDGTRAPMPVQVGDRVAFSLESGYVNQLPGHRDVGDDTRLLIRAEGIVAVLDPEVDATAVASPWPGYIADGPQDSEYSEADFDGWLY